MDHSDTDFRFEGLDTGTASRRPGPRRFLVRGLAAAAVVAAFGGPLLGQDQLYLWYGDEPVGGEYGTTLRRLGDIDADGVGDLAIGDYQWSGLGSAYGKVELRSGRTGALLNAVVGDNIRWRTFQATGIGDFDQDGVGDYIVGAPGASVTSSEQGACYLYSGRTHTRIRTHFGLGGDNMGHYCTVLGDLDADGIVEYAVSMLDWPGAGGGSGRGQVRVFNGVDGSIRYFIVGGYTGDGLGAELQTMSDLDGDGVRDLIFSADLNEPHEREFGRVHCCSGATGALLWQRTGTEYGQRLGGSIDVLPDRDGDGIEDLVVGLKATVGDLTEHCLILSGHDGTLLARVDTPSPDAIHGFGTEVARAGDLNGDGWDELAVGAYLTNSGAGAVHLLCGRTLTLLYTFRRSALEQTGFGEQLAYCGDLTGDGIAELAVGARHLSLDPGDRRGGAFVFKGNDLYLQATDPAPATGDTVHFDTRGGKPGASALVALVEIDGQGMFRLLGQGVVDADGTYRQTGTVPPGVSGVEFGLQSFVPSMRRPGKWADSAVERVRVQ